MLKAIIRLVFTVGIMSLTACGVTSELVFENKSHNVLYDIKLYASDHLIWQGDVDIGATIKVVFTVDKDGALKVTGRDGFNSGYLGYVTKNESVRHTIIYNSTGEADYQFSIQE